MRRCLSELLEGQMYKVLQGSSNIQVEGLAWDTRDMSKNTLFICVKNKNIDRHAFAKEAIRKGAIAIIVENEITDLPDEVTVIQVKDTRKSMSLIAQTYYERPMEHMKVIGVTGTNGKTSTTYFISQILTRLGKKTGLIGTIENSIDGKTIETKKLNPTTPDAIELQSSLAEMRAYEVNYAVMEVSSSALVQDRVYGCFFDIAIFTNLTQDHLEEHGTMKHYKSAKMQLFHKCKLGIINTDDEMGKEIIAKNICKPVTYGINSDADFKAINIKYNQYDVSFDLVCSEGIKKVTFKVPGIFSVYNALAALSCSVALGYGLDEVITALQQIIGVPGRFEVIPNSKGILAIVDYAHSPDSLKNILISVKQFTKGRVIIVFGCGGERDRSKRPIMGEIAGYYADICIITSDNPRKESPQKIMLDIEEGMKKQVNCYEKIEDREKAIRYALAQARENDTVVIAGKGHEGYQIIGDKKIHLNDAEIVKAWFDRKVD